MRSEGATLPSFYRPVTIIDVARQAGLSASTVSRVLNKSGYFSEETLTKVEAAVEELGYRPNWSARSLRGKPSNLVGLIIPDISNIFYTGVASSLASSLRDYQYEMILCVSDEDPEKDLGFLQILEEKRVDGIIYTPPANGDNSACIREMVARGIPVVEINRQRSKDLLDGVLADNLRAVQQVIEYLHGLGHERIAMISGPATVTTGAERLMGYQTAIARAGLPVNPTYLKIGYFTSQFGEEATRALLALETPPTAIFAASNRIALGSLKQLNQMKVSIPDDLSFVAFDDTEWLEAWNPPITTVDIAIDEMAKLVVELLHRRVREKKNLAKPVTYHLSTSMIIRQSCKPLRPTTDPI